MPCVGHRLGPLLLNLPPAIAASTDARREHAALLYGIDRRAIEEGPLSHTDLTSKLSPVSIGVD